MFDVVIIGCGIVGAAAAYELSRYRLNIAVIEKENDVSNAASKANSGIIHAGYDPKPGSLMAKLNVEGAHLASQICKDLDVPYRRCGSLVVAFDERETEILNMLLERGKKNGVPSLEIWDAEKLREQEPNLNKDARCALYAPTAAVVSPWEYALALAETAVLNGVRLFLNHEATAISRAEGCYHIQTRNGGGLECKTIVNAAGLYSDAVHNMAAEPSFKIYPDKGEYYLMDKSEGETVSHVIFQCPTPTGKGTLISPTVHGNLIVGPNNEPPADKDDVSTSAAGLGQVSRAARKTVPDLNLRSAIRTFGGIRAASDSEDFIIAEAKGAPGFIDLAGIKSPGLTAAPAIAKMAAALLKKSGLELTEKENHIRTRKKIHFAGLNIAEKQKLISARPEYGRVICRCETVTEGEILDAIRSPVPPVSVEGVKRRCNAGMGRCQGGFCGPRVVELLSAELGVSPLAVPQDKAGSFILVSETKKGGCHG